MGHDPEVAAARTSFTFSCPFPSAPQQPFASNIVSGILLWGQAHQPAHADSNSLNTRVREREENKHTNTLLCHQFYSVYTRRVSNIAERQGNINGRQKNRANDKKKISTQCTLQGEKKRKRRKKRVALKRTARVLACACVVRTRARKGEHVGMPFTYRRFPSRHAPPSNKTGKKKTKKLPRKQAHTRTVKRAPSSKQKHDDE